MALVALLRGVNVGGHRRIRPAALAEALAHLGTVNLGAAGTLVIPARIRRAQLRTELAARLPFPCEIVICGGQEIVELVSMDPFAGQPTRPGIVRFVSVLSRAPRSVPALPMSMPAEGRWIVKVLGREHRFVFGLYRRHLRVIGHLGTFDRLFGVPVTTRNWNTICAIAGRVHSSERWGLR